MLPDAGSAAGGRWMRRRSASFYVADKASADHFTSSISTSKMRVDPAGMLPASLSP